MGPSSKQGVLTIAHEWLKGSPLPEEPATPEAGFGVLALSPGGKQNVSSSNDCRDFRRSKVAQTRGEGVGSQMRPINAFYLAVGINYLGLVRAYYGP